MDAAKMKEILKTEYGICDEAEFNAAVSKSAGINLGLFTMPLTERSVRCEQTNKKSGYGVMPRYSPYVEE